MNMFVINRALASVILMLAIGCSAIAKPLKPIPATTAPAAGAPSSEPLLPTMPSPDDDPGLKGLYPPPSTPLIPGSDYLPIPSPEESMDLELPTVKQLLPVGGKLPAIRLEA